MKSSAKYSAPLSFLLLSSAVLSADPLPEQMTFVPWAGGFWRSEWEGVTKRTYFHQWSTDMVNWNYSPLMRFGTGPHECLLASSTDKFFARLLTVDDTTATTLQQARDADFDNDGIPNYYEIETLLTDPLDKNSAGGDSDADGLADGWELFHFGGLGIANPTAALKPDGLPNLEKAELGLNPNLDYSAETAPQPAKYNFDPVSRLIDLVAPVASAAFSPDEEGNILTAQ